MMQKLLLFYLQPHQQAHLDIETQLPKLNFSRDRMHVWQIKNLIADEKIYLSSDLNRKLYKNSLLQIFRMEWEYETNYFGEQCGGFPKIKFKIIEGNKVGVRFDIFNKYTVGYFTYLEGAEYGYVKESKNFEFEMTTKSLGRNPKTITKKYRTLPKEGQELKPFDYEEIE